MKLFSDTTLLKENETEIAKANCFTLSVFSVICTGLNLVLFFVSPHISGFENLTPVYLVFLVLNLCFVPVLFLYAPHHLSIVRPLCYAAAVLFHAFGIIAGVFLNQDQAAGTYFSILYILPLLIIDNPLKIHIVTVAAVTVFCVSAYYVKDGICRTSDITNALCNAILAVFVSAHVIRIKIRAIDARRMLMFQRDTDMLTQLPNRRKLFETLAAAEKPESGTPVTGVLMLDIDLFKQFNDTYGHQAGDDCLRALGTCFSGIAAEHAVKFYRYGGEEFTVLCRSGSPGELAELARSINAAVCSLHIPSQTSPYHEVTVSIGYAHVSECSGSGFRALLAASDLALYYAKANGRNTACSRSDVPQEFIDANDFSPSFR